VTKPDDKSLCDADSASFSPEDGYTLVIDPKCIGNPKSMGFSVAMFIDTDKSKDDAPMASDRVPDQGFQMVAARGETAPPPAPIPAPPGAPGPIAPNAAPSVTRGPAGAPAVKPTPAHTPAPSRGAQAAPGAPAPAGAPAAAAPAAPLARTGSPSETRALFGLGIMLLGVGMLVMTGRPAPRVSVR